MNTLMNVVSGFMFGVGLILAAAFMRIALHMGIAG